MKYGKFGVIWLFLTLYGFDWRRLALRMGDMDWSIHYYIYLMSRRGDKETS
jgi:hypothetical protein